MKITLSICFLLASTMFLLRGVVIDNQTEQRVEISNFGFLQKNEFFQEERVLYRPISLMLNPGRQVDLARKNVCPDVITIKIGKREWFCNGLEKDSTVLCSENEDGMFNVDVLNALK